MFCDDIIKNKRYVQDYCVENVIVKWKICSICGRRTIKDDNYTCDCNESQFEKEYQLKYFIGRVLFPKLRCKWLLINMIRHNGSMHVPNELMAIICNYYSNNLIIKKF